LNNLPTRPGDNDDHSKAINTLLFSYDSHESDDVKRGKLAIYKQAVSDLPQWCSEQALSNFLSGKVERKSNSDFRPSPEAFAREARRVLAEEIERRNIAERSRRVKQLQAPRKQTSTMPWEIGQDRARMAAEGRSLIVKGVGHTEFRTRAKSGDWPEGTIWIAATGEVYAPVKQEVE
jgi:hypothetical protein